MKHKRILALLAMILTVLMARAWTPSEKYAKWLPAFKIDKAWQFQSNFSGTSGQLGGASTVDYPDVISWSIMTWDNRTGSDGDDDYQMDWAEIYLYNTSSGGSLKLCKIDFTSVTGSNKNVYSNYYSCSIPDYNSCSTWKVNYKYLSGHEDGSVFMYFITYLSQSARSFITSAGSNIAVKIYLQWDGSTYTEYSGSLDAGDRTLIDNPTAPVISNQTWTIHNNQTCISFNHGVSSTSDLTLKVNDTYTNTTSSVDFGNPCYYHPSNLSSNKDYMYYYNHSRFRYKAYTEKTYSFSTANYAYTALGNNGTSKTMSSSEVAFCPPVFAQPTGVSATDNKDGSVTVTWNNNKHTSGEPYDNSGFVVERATNSSFTENYKSYSVALNYETGSGSTNYTLTDAFTNRDEGNKTFYYRIHREHAVATEVNATKNITVNTNWAKLSSFEAKTNSNNKIDLSWTYSSGIRNSNLTLKLTYGGKTLNYASNSGTLQYNNIDDVQACTPTTFTAQLYANNATYSTAKTSVAMRSTTDAGVVDTMIASAGYYNDRVNINWTINSSHTNFSSFELFRLANGSSDWESLTSMPFTAGVLNYTYNDNTCVPGVYYEYKLKAYSSCNGTVSQSGEKNVLGFAQPYGVVSGQIAYDGNQAVENVSVVAEGVSQFTGKSVSLIASDQPNITIPTTVANQMLSPKSGTIELFFRPSNASTKNPIIYISGFLELYGENNGLRIYVVTSSSSGFTLYANNAISSGTYTHIAITMASAANNQVTLKLYVNGDSVASRTYTPASNCTTSFPSPLCFGRNFNTYMTGNLDEIRIWNRARTTEEIDRYKDAYLSGTETGLTGYYRCDDNVSHYLYDLSKTGSNYNGRHIPVSGVTIDENTIPTVEQLGHKAFTDENGNYLFNNIPYSSDGSLYNIIPMFGIHEFSPSQRPLFFNASANTHNAVDFEDVSSFPVSGKVTFYNTNYPVKGCQFYIDGTTLCTKDGVAIETDEKGEYSIEVPIGQHYITVKKDGHTFANAGRYPAESGSRHEFINEITNLTFKDSTFVLLTGRVAGGSDEEDKPHGFGQGDATIGQARITLGTHGDLYNLNLDETNGRTFTMPTDSLYGECNSVTTTGRAYQNLAHNITILTDSNTGEFNAMLPPIDFEVRNVELVHNNGNITFSLSSIGDIPLGTQNVNTVSTDSVELDSSSYRKFNYAYALDVIHYSVPVMSVIQNTDNNAFGSRFYYYEDKISGFRDTIPLYTVGANGNITYRFGYPCFNQDESYTWQISAYETYINYDDSQNPDTTRQPFRYGIVNVSNNFGEQVKNKNSLMDTTFVVSNSDVVYVSGSEMMLDSTGTTYYSFVAGEPNIFSPYTSNATITYQDRDRTRYYNWSGNGNTNVIVFGAKISGTNFVTKGPDEVFFILRDPIGSDSYAEWESGQTITKTLVKTKEQAREEAIDNYVIISHQKSVAISAPLGTGFAHRSLEVTNKVGPAESYEGSTQWTDSKTWEFSSAVSVSTSQDNSHEMVGSPADVFIGAGTNRLYGNAQQVYINRDTAGNYSIEDKAVLSVTTEFSTQFNYSQHYIEDFLIPNLEALRNQLLIQVPQSQYNTSYTNMSDSAVYITTLSPDDENFGEEGTYLVIWPQASMVPDSAYVQHKVYDYNNQIRRWEDVLTHNEHCKVMVHNSSQPFDREGWEEIVYGESDDVFADITGPSIDSTYTLLDRLDSLYEGGWLVQNYSIGAGADLSVVESRNYTTMNNGLTERDGFMAGVKGENGGTILGVGVEFVWEAMTGYTQENQRGTETGNSSTVSYSVSISTDEALTFDVYQAPDGFGPIFAARGGQTLCPYQDEEVTKYYQPGSVIQERTIPLGEPRITVQNPIATNVPVGNKAFYTIELANTATPDALTSFILRQDPSTNPDGAILKVDGKPLDETGIMFNLSGGDHYNKTLELSQTREDVLDYDSIAIIFHPDCYLYDADTIWVSAHFVQTCSNIALKTDKNILNNTTGNTVRFTIDGFTPNYRNLANIQLQYQSEGDDQWHLVKQYPEAPDTAFMSAIIYDNFSFTKPSYADGTYRFRAVTLCQFGNETVNNESEPVTIVVDMAAPEALGLPNPIDGIYTASNQIYVDFNEPIQPGRVLSDNVLVEGVLNAHQVDHSIALDLENNTAVSNATYQLGTTPFTLEMWINYSNAGTIFSYAGGGTSGIEFSVDASNHLVAKINNVQYTSMNAMLPNRWLYLVIQCDTTTRDLNATCSYDDQNVTLFQNQSFTQPASSGNIRLGGNGLVAKVHDVALWKAIRSTAESLSERSESKSAYTPDIISLWRMDEGKGTIANDDVRQRHLTLAADAWYYNHVNYALHVAAGDSAMVNISECPIMPGKSYLFEMWFRASGDAELFRLADGSFSTSISNGNLVVNGRTFSMRNYKANVWHHLAIINPKISTPVIALDGAQLPTASLNTLPTFASSHIIFGGADHTNDIDIDEVRLWNINTTLDATRLQMGNCLDGDEAGLVAYYPMEAYLTDPISSQISTEFSLVDKTDATGTRAIVHSNAVSAQSVSVPALVESRPLEYVAHTNTTSENRIMVNITESAQRIEGCWLEMTVKDIVDANGNYSEPIRWTAFVNRNQLVWDENSYMVVKDEIADTTLELKIVNNGSTVQSWTVDNVPSCMTLSETSGRLNPLQTKTITCTIDATTDRGENEYTLYLTGNENMDCPLYITTKVYANKPGWTINPSEFEHSMNIIAVAEVEGVMADDEEDMVAAFVDGKLAGVANLQLLPAMGRYYLMMTIFQDSATSTSSRKITFRYWDASSGLVYSSAIVYSATGQLMDSDSLTYQDNLALGDIADPIRLVMDTVIEQEINVDRGWNWISFNVNPASNDFTDILGKYTDDFIIIKSQYGSGQPNASVDSVVGTIGKMDCRLGYKLWATKSFDVLLDGTAAPLNSVITLPAQRWAWFGFLPQKAMTVNAALSNINPSVGDLVKSQTQFASWDGYQWVGSLSVMQPGQSYVYKNKSNAALSLTYPDYADISYLMPSLYYKSLTYFNPVDAGNYQGNMSITAIVKYQGNNVSTAEVGVFAGTECRAASTYIDGYYFITVPGDNSVQLSMKVVYNDSIYTLQGNLTYRNDAVVGTLDNPYVIDLSSGAITDDPGVSGGTDDPDDPDDPDNPDEPLTVVNVEAVNGNNVEKVLIDNEVFIIRNGEMYDALGRRRK